MTHPTPTLLQRPPDSALYHTTAHSAMAIAVNKALLQFCVLIHLASGYTWTTDTGLLITLDMMRVRLQQRIHCQGVHSRTPLLQRHCQGKYSRTHLLQIPMAANHLVCAGRDASI